MVQFAPLVLVGLVLMVPACTPKPPAATVQNTDAQQTQQRPEDLGFPEIPQIVWTPTPKPPDAEIPESYRDKGILAKTTEFHRAIWADYQRQAWKGTAKDVRGVGSAIPTPGNPFQSQSLRSVMDVSIHQPLQLYSCVDFYDYPIEFFLGGHTLVGSISPPGHRTLVLGPSPFVQGSQYTLSPPKDYHLVYQNHGNASMEKLLACDARFKSLANMETTILPVEEQTECDLYFAGLTLTTLNYSSMQANNAFDELLKKQSVAVWRPVPQSEDFRCLGDVATNGETNKPYTENDFAQGILDGENAISERFATYCVHKDFAVKGKLVPQALAANHEVAFYQISYDATNAPEGYAYGQFFHTLPHPHTAQDVANAEVWVLNLNGVKFLPSDVAYDDSQQDAPLCASAE